MDVRILKSLSVIGQLIGYFVATSSLNKFLSRTTTVESIVGRIANGCCGTNSVLPVSLASILVVSLMYTGGIYSINSSM